MIEFEFVSPKQDPRICSMPCTRWTPTTKLAIIEPLTCGCDITTVPEEYVMVHHPVYMCYIDKKKKRWASYGYCGGRLDVDAWCACDDLDLKIYNDADEFEGKHKLLCKKHFIESQK